MSGIRSSRPKANAAACACTGAFSMKSQVSRTNSAAGGGTFTSSSAASTGRPARSRPMKASMTDVSAPASVMPSR